MGTRLPVSYTHLVDGNGTYFSAKNPDEIITGLKEALTSISAKIGAAAAAATSTLNPVAGNNFAYVASYTTTKWQGNLEARTIDTGSGVVSDTATWCVENITGGSCTTGTVVADNSSSSTVSVSYTHLDVYKRQALPRQPALPEAR